MSQDDYVGYNITLYEQAYQSKRTKLFIFVGLLVLGFLINLIVYFQGNDVFPTVQSLLLISVATIYFVLPGRMRGVLRKRYDALPVLKVPCSYIIDELQITAENELSRSEMVWSLFTRADNYGKWVMLHLQNHTFLAFDITHIVPPNELQDLLKLLDQHKVSLNPDTTAYAW